MIHRALVLAVLLATSSSAVASRAAAQEDCASWSVLVDAPSRYEAGVWAGVPRDHRIAEESGIEAGGLVRLMGGRARQESFVIESGIHQVVRARAACTTADAIDVVITDQAIFVVRVYGVSDGVFGLADVYRMPRRASARMRSRLRALGGRALEGAVDAILAPAES